MARDMHRLFRLLLAMAVLCCGLHLSPAEADGGVWTADEAVAHAQVADHGDEGHPGGDLMGACHNHCPVTPEIGGAPAIDPPRPVRAMLFARPGWPLRPATQAQPIEPPAA